MPNQSCCVGPCDNKSWRPKELVVRGHVKKLTFHSFPKDEVLRKLWDNQIKKGLTNYEKKKGEPRLLKPFQVRKANGNL